MPILNSNPTTHLTSCKKYWCVFTMSSEKKSFFSTLCSVIGSVSNIGDDSDPPPPRHLYCSAHSWHSTMLNLPCPWCQHNFVCVTCKTPTECTKQRYYTTIDYVEPKYIQLTSTDNTLFRYFNTASNIIEVNCSKKCFLEHTGQLSTTPNI